MQQSLWIRASDSSCAPCNMRNVVVGNQCSHVFSSCQVARVDGLRKCKISKGSLGGHCVTDEIIQEERLEPWWPDFLLDPKDWWDNWSGNKSLHHPDFRHKTSTEALSVENCCELSGLDAKLAMCDSEVRERAGSSPSLTRGNDASPCRKLTDDGASEVRTLNKCLDDGELGGAVKALELLVQQGCYVGKSSFYLVVKRCIAKKDLNLGRRVHALTVKGGWESDTFRANHIIRMYASHGRLEEAVKVFNKVPAPDTFMWFSIISAHAQHGQTTQAISLYRQMCKTPLQPNSYVFVIVLKACATARDLATGKNVHEDVQKSQVDRDDVFVGNGLVDMYAKCGSLADARNLFDRLPRRDVVTWNAMIGGYAQHELGHEALALYAIMQQDGTIAPDQVTFVCILQACASVSAFHEGKKLHGQIQQRGLESDVVVGSCLVDMYGKCGSLLDAEQVFNRMPTKNVVTWTAMIAGYAQLGLGQKALAHYTRMQDEGISPANHTFVSLLRACASIGALGEGKKLHTRIQDRGLEANFFVANGLVDMYSKCRSVEDARSVFDRMTTREVVTWNALMTGYAQQGFSQEALALYARMQNEGTTSPDNVTFVCLLQACAKVGALHQGKQLHAQIQDRGLEADIVVGNCLVNMYAKCGRLEDARRVFDTLPRRDVVTWNALLNGYAEHSSDKMATQCFEKMCEQGIAPDATTFISLLVACSHAGLVYEGQRYFKLMVYHGIVPTVNHYNCMVDVLGRSGFLDEAESLLLTMPFENDIVGWTSLLSACKSHGDIKRGRRCFERLVEMEPRSAVPYVLLGNIFANASMWKDVERIESLRKSAGAEKKPAKACIELKNKVHEFTVGEQRSDISSKLRSMNSRLKEEGGHVPHTQLVLKCVSQQEKEDALCGHAEKLALAYGLLNTADGTTLLVTKNLRMCNDCHSGTKIMSSLEKREIIVRDAHRIHRFLDGSCSCGDRH